MTIEKFVRESDKEVLGRLEELLRIPSVSPYPDHDNDCMTAAQWLADHLDGLGCRATLLASDTHPVVWAESPRVEGRPTVLARLTAIGAQGPKAVQIRCVYRHEYLGQGDPVGPQVPVRGIGVYHQHRVGKPGGHLFQEAEQP